MQPPNSSLRREKESCISSSMCVCVCVWGSRARSKLCSRPHSERPHLPAAEVMISPAPPVGPSQAFISIHAPPSGGRRERGKKNAATPAFPSHTAAPHKGGMRRAVLQKRRPGGGAPGRERRPAERGAGLTAEARARAVLAAAASAGACPPSHGAPPALIRVRK